MTSHTIFRILLPIASKNILLAYSIKEQIKLIGKNVLSNCTIQTEVNIRLSIIIKTAEDEKATKSPMKISHDVSAPFNIVAHISNLPKEHYNKQK